MGAVAVTEQAIINEAHRRGLIVPNRPKRDEDENTQAAGAQAAANVQQNTMQSLLQRQQQMAPQVAAMRAMQAGGGVPSMPMGQG